MTTGLISSIKTLDVVGLPKEPTNITIGKTASDSVLGQSLTIATENAYQVAVCTSAVTGKARRLESTSIGDVVAGKLREFFEGFLRLIRAPGVTHDVEQLPRHQLLLFDHFPNAIGDVGQSSEHRLPIFNRPRNVSGFAFVTAPLSATLNVVDKKYSEVFRAVFLLRQPADADEPLPTDWAYWNSLKTVAAAYSILRTESPRSAELVQPLTVVDPSGGVRLIWRTRNKQVKANFGGRPDLKSYLYFESGQIYDVEALDAPTLARRLEWLV